MSPVRVILQVPGGSAKPNHNQRRVEAGVPRMSGFVNPVSIGGLVTHQAADGYWVDKSTHAGNASLYSPLIVVGLCGAARHLQDDPDRAHWIAALERFASSFIKYFSEANAFGILPCRIYPDRAPQPARKWKEQQYRYFIETNV